jgi:hypothetical protein
MQAVTTFMPSHKTYGNIHQTFTNLYFHLSEKYGTVCEAIQTAKIRTSWWERGAYPWNPTEYYAGLYRYLLTQRQTICAFWGCWRNMVTRASVQFSRRERVIGRGRPRASIRWRQVRFYSWLLTPFAYKYIQFASSHSVLATDRPANIRTQEKKDISQYHN